jgi:serine protease Do
MIGMLTPLLSSSALRWSSIRGSCFALAGLATATAASEVDQVVERTKPAIVRIEVLMEEGSGGRMVKQRGFGSGAIIDERGHVITNHHVAGRGTRFRVTLADRQEIPATLVGSDALTDIAVIRLDLDARRDPSAPLFHAGFGDSGSLQVGDEVYALGSPAALSQSVTKGIVSNTAMIAPKIVGGLTLDGEKVGELVRWIGHDAVIYGGNSGGPLVAADGNIVGVNAVGIGSIGGAIPGNLARQVATELIEHGSVTRGWIGLEVQELLRSQQDKRGVLVASVFAASPAGKAGLLPGDFIHHFNGEAIEDCRSPEDLPLFNARVLNSKPGETLTLEGERGGQAMTWKVEVLRRAANQAFEREFNEWGLTARDLSPMGALQLQRSDTRGVQVHSVRSGGPSATAKPALAAWDIILRLNDREIATLDDFIEFHRSLPDDGSETAVLVTFERGVNHERFITVVKVGPERQPQSPAGARRAWLGLSGQELGPELADALGLKGTPGIRVTRVINGSPAESAGLRPDDILTKMDGNPIPVRRPEDLRAFLTSIGSRDPQTTVKFDLLRNAAAMSLEVTLGTGPSDDDDATKMKDADFEFAAIDLTDARRDAYNLPADLTGARVTEVTANGWASLAGLRDDDLVLAVDGTPVAGAADLEKQLAEIKAGHRSHTVFLVRRGIHHHFIELEPSWNEIAE